MSDAYQKLTQELSATIGGIRKDIPDVMKGFSAMASAALEDGALSKKNKEMIALAIGVATHCKGCIGFHVKALIALGITREELVEVLGMAIPLCTPPRPCRPLKNFLKGNNAYAT